MFLTKYVLESSPYAHHRYLLGLIHYQLWKTVGILKTSNKLLILWLWKWVDCSLFPRTASPQGDEHSAWKILFFKRKYNTPETVIHSVTKATNL